MKPGSILRAAPWLSFDLYFSVPHGGTFPNRESKIHAQPPSILPTARRLAAIPETARKRIVRPRNERRFRPRPSRRKRPNALFYFRDKESRANRRSRSFHDRGRPAAGKIYPPPFPNKRARYGRRNRRTALASGSARRSRHRITAAASQPFR